MYVCGGAFRIREDYSDYIRVEAINKPKGPGRTVRQTVAEFYKRNPVAECLGWKKYPAATLIDQPFYAAAFRGGFYCTVTRGKPKHLVRLYFRDGDKNSHWIASVQVDFVFNSKAQAMFTLKQTITHRKFFFTQASAENHVPY